MGVGGGGVGVETPVQSGGEVVSTKLPKSVVQNQRYVPGSLLVLLPIPIAFQPVLSMLALWPGEDFHPAKTSAAD